MSELYFTRVRLKSDASVQSLLPLLLAPGDGPALGAHTGHHLVWSLFSDSPSRKRDFLWREMSPGTFYILSARLPVDGHALFEIAPPKPFSPALRAGDRLAFSLRANPVKRRVDKVRQRTVKHDVVMDALRDVEKGRRAAVRLDTVQNAGATWLARQGAASGFSVVDTPVRVDGYQQHRVARTKGAPMSFSTLEMEGVLTVTAPDAFIPAVGQGFGGAKGYGCGLMLIKRSVDTRS